MHFTALVINAKIFVSTYIKNDLKMYEQEKCEIKTKLTYQRETILPINENNFNI